MTDYRRIMTVVDLSARGQATARHAWSLALKQGARFCIGHVVDWDHGNGDFSTLTPPEIEDRLEGVVKRKLMAMADLINARQAAFSIGFEGPARGFASIVGGWQPDLLIVDAQHDFGLGTDAHSGVPGWDCDVMVTDAPSSGFLPAGKLVQSFVQAILPSRPATR